MHIKAQKPKRWTMPVIHLLHLSPNSPFIACYVIMKLNFTAGTMLSFVSKGCQRDTGGGAFFSWLLSAFSTGSYGTCDFPRHQSPVKNVASKQLTVIRQHPVASTFPLASSLQQFSALLREDFQQVLPVQHPRDFSITQCAMAMPLQQGLDLSPEVKDGALLWARQSHYSESFCVLHFPR